MMNPVQQKLAYLKLTSKESDAFECINLDTNETLITKAYYRRGRAYIGMKSYYKALDYFFFIKNKSNNQIS